MCDLLTVQDSNIVQVALNGLENILKAGNQHKVKPNPYAVLVEECYGMYPFKEFCFLLIYVYIFKGLDKIEFLQSHEKMEIYEKAFAIIKTYFDNDEEEDAQLAPQTENNQFQFASDQQVPDRFQF